MRDRYLPPSIEQAEHYLNTTQGGAGIAEITAMIYWHHKIRPYSGAFPVTVEIFRKADWTDVSLGMLNFGASPRKLRNLRRKFPNAGFHWFLIRKISANFLRHPLNPLPMFKS